MKESYEFMRMPCQFRHSAVHEEFMPLPHSHEGCHIRPFPDQTPVGMAYVPYQQWGDLYTADEGFPRGTLFPELDFPFKGGDCSCE